MPWPQVRFGNLYDSPSRNGLNRPRNTRGAGFKMINMGEIFAHDRIGDIPMERVQMSLAEIDRFSVKLFDLMFARQSMVAEGAGKCSIVSGVPELTCFESHLIRVRLNQQIVDPRYYFYYFRSPAGRPKVEAIITGAAQKGIRGSELEEIEVHCPPLHEQRRIASILSAYDDLIENNTRRIAILEEMARRIYEEWFVRFRFPGHEQVKMVESELGLIPEGWSTQRLDEAALVTMGQSPSSEHYNVEGKGLPFHQGVTDFGAHYPSHRTYCTVDGRMALEGDILMSVRAPVGRINLAPSDMVIGRGLCAIRSRTGRQWFLLHRLLEKFKEEDCMGNGAIFKAVTKQDVQGILFPKASDTLEENFEKLVTPLWLLIRNLTHKNINLRATRDLLLPKLISGELDVSSLPEPEEALTV